MDSPGMSQSKAALPSAFSCLRSGLLSAHSVDSAPVNATGACPSLSLSWSSAGTMACNNVSVHRGLCGCCVRSAKWIPVVFISAIVTWSYYAYVVQLVLFNVTHVWQQAIMLLLYHISFVLFVWSYGRTIFSPLGSVPKRFRLTSEDMDRIDSADDHKSVLDSILVNKDLPCTMRSIQQEIRYCSECSLIKPDRTHHCSVCGACVLKMDHHCPWVNNCVAYHNYKFFILFLGYALLYCIYVALSSLKYFLEFWTNGPASNGADKFHVLFLFFVSAMFSISLASLFGYHCYLVSKNMTTLEAFRAPVFRHGPDKMAFHLGKYNNFQEVFGDNKWLWFLPVFTSFGDGITFPQRGQLDEEAGLLGPSPPTTQFPSAESMPMLRQGLANGGVSDDDMWDSRPPQAQRQASSSSSENEAARLNGGSLAVAMPLRQQHEDTTLVTVSM